jgi:tripartite-type tricarboxylate transporter receptor subunit TctC
MNGASRSGALVIAAAACLTLVPAGVRAAEDVTFKDKTITITVSTGEGGTYSLLGRLVGRHMPRYLPGTPNMVAQNMPGGGHMLATNYLYNVAPKDGTAIGTVNQTVVSHQVLDGKGVRYDAAKFNWLGGFGSGNAVLAVWHTANVNTFEDLRTKEIIAGATGEGSSAYHYPLVMNRILGTKLKIVKGYKGIPDVELAMTRGEVHARAGSYASYGVNHPDWLKDKKITFPVQIGVKREKDLPDVPLWSEVAKTAEERQVLRLVAAPISLGRPFLAPPDVPANRLALLRSALAKTMADAAFLAEAAKQNLEIDPMTAEEVTDIVKETVSAPPDIAEKAKAAMDPNAT